MASTTTLIEAAVGLVLFVYVMAALIPGAVSTLVNINSSAVGAQNNSLWGAAPVALWGIIGIFVIIAVLFMIYAFAKKEMGR